MENVELANEWLFGNGTATGKKRDKDRVQAERRFFCSEKCRSF
jgi:hypothetical protein